MDDFLDELTLDYWRHFTAAEWEAFLTGQDLDDIVEFIHEMHEEDPKVVEDMFAAMPKEMLDDFRNTPELSYQFSKFELETIKRGVKQNQSTEKIEESHQDEKKSKKGNKKHGKKNHPGKKHNGGKKHQGGKKHKKDQQHHKNKKNVDHKKEQIA